ncbi:MAG: hypothetical protein K1Y36_19695 [Blastocatellia bacterium]|nr:hypothetical protein [Blastocatellia bacterium]
MSDGNFPEQKPFGRVNRRTAAYGGESKDWWRTSRRKFIIGGAVAGVGALAVAGGGLYWLLKDDTSEVNHDSLDLQKKHGWNIGSEEKTISLPNAQTKDSLGTENWKKYLDQNAMLAAWTPKAPNWAPYFVPTLIQSLQFETLRKVMTPVFTPDMQEAYERAQSIARDFLANAQNAADTAIVVDVPGRDSVAFGAGMADSGRLIAGFDNFPHPLGVVPSHETLGALLYYTGEIETKQAQVKDTAPAVFLLDSKRLSEYKDEETQFDNRFLAKLPSAQKLREAGIKSILYITPDRARSEELDDLNEDFVAFKDQGLSVAVLPLSDFTPVSETVAQKQADGTTQTQVVRHYYYGGNPLGHTWFFYSYPFYSPYPSYVQRYPTYSRPPSPPPVSAPRYLPAPRPTMFSGTRIGGSASGVGRSKPSGFGRTTVRVSPSGSVVGTRPGRSGYYSPSRSGSFGRSGSSSGG